MSTPNRQRIFWLDATKAYGMFLVYYGHTVERFYNGENQASLLQDRLIYAFQMPFFLYFQIYLCGTQLAKYSGAHFLVSTKDRSLKHPCAGPLSAWTHSSALSNVANSANHT